MTKTIIKKYVKYYVSVLNTVSGENNYYEKITENEDYNPFIMYKDDSSWTKIEELPKKELFLLKFTTDIISVKVDKQESAALSPAPEEEVVEENRELTYYYDYYEKQVELSRFVKVVCTDCDYCKIRDGFKKRYQCFYPEHTFTDYITGKIQNGDCRDFNNNGECRFYINKILFKEEEKENEENISTESEQKSPEEKSLQENAKINSKEQ